MRLRTNLINSIREELKNEISDSWPVSKM
jgi:hypothetical protein